MDSTSSPLRIPPEMAMYAEKYEIFDLVQKMVRNLLVDKPDEPIQYLINLLRRGSVEVPRVMLLGPAASGKKTIAKKLREQTQAIHISADSILKENTDLAKKALQFKDRQQEVPEELWIKLLQQRLSKADCLRRGWVLEGIPQTRREALLLQQVGIAPDHVVMLEAPDAVLIERSLGKRVDPVTGDVYHITFLWPEDRVVGQRLMRPEGLSEQVTAARLLQYHQEAHALQRTYQYCLKIVDADQPPVDVLAQVLNHVLCKPQSAAPYTPRILLFGPPGSGKSLQAALIAQKYNIVNICCGELLKTVSAGETRMGELIKPYLESGERVPDSMVLQILTERLSKLDCTTRGWVLHGFPRDVEQAEKLQESNFVPSRVFFLEITEDVAVERVTLRAIDPVTGERYHYLNKPVPSPEVQARLQHNPRDSEARVLEKVREHWIQALGLQGLYPDAVHINADQDPHTVFESLESRLVGHLPKRLSNARQAETQEQRRTRPEGGGPVSF